MVKLSCEIIDDFDYETAMSTNISAPPSSCDYMTTFSTNGVAVIDQSEPFKFNGESNRSW